MQVACLIQKAWNPENASYDRHQKTSNGVGCEKNVKGNVEGVKRHSEQSTKDFLCSNISSLIQFHKKVISSWTCKFKWQH